MKRALLRLSDRILAAWARARGLEPVPAVVAREAVAAADDLVSFCMSSGFLRDGRYPGGRLAERKIHHRLGPIYLLARHRWTPGDPTHA